MTDFQKTLSAVIAALNDPNGTVGTTVCYERVMVVLGNMMATDPTLSMVAIDELGRLWKERHHDGKSELTCVLDLRALKRE